VRVTSDNAKRANALTLQATGSALGSNHKACQLAEGQLLIVYNGDEDRTSGDAEVSVVDRCLLFWSFLQCVEKVARRCTCALTLLMLHRLRPSLN